MQVLRTTLSLCPECLRVLPATIYVRDDKVYMQKRCPEHGEFEDLYWGDYELYKKFDGWWIDGSGLENPRTRTEKGCPFDCGVCPQHKTHTILAIIDVTNRCNMRCPICFAYTGMPVYEPSLGQIEEMLRNLRANRPIPAPALQLSGGEPTMRDDLPEIIKLAKEVGFKHVEVNTNGVRIAKDLGYFKNLVDAGMSTLYLSFDSLRPEPYYKLRGVDALPLKLKVLENARKLGFDSVVLVVTLAKGVNDSDVGDIIRFAARNSDIVRCVNVQPISFAGAGRREEIKNMRITVPDFLKLVEEQTNGQIKAEDFRPVTWPVPFARLAGALKGKPYPEFTMSPFCGAATFFIAEGDGKIAPVTRLTNVDKFAESLGKAAEDFSSGRKLKARLRLASSLRYIRGKLLRRLILDVIKSGTYEALGNFMRKVVMVGCMHFMDLWNFDLERVQRCSIHYATVDGRIIPFCSMNSIHRSSYEAKYSVPYEQWLKIRREGIAKPAPIAA